jgi:hypothetical protein
MRKGCVGMAFLLLIFLAVIAVKTYPAGIGSVAVEAQEISGVTSDAAQNGDGATAIRDLTDAFDVILKGADKDFIAGYQVDSNFLMWLDAEYGDDAVLRLACYVKDGNASVDYAYRELDPCPVA